MKIKKLIWSGIKAPDQHCYCTHCTAISPLGSVQIEWKSWKKYSGFLLYIGDNYQESFDAENIEAAMVLAEEFYIKKAFALITDLLQTKA